jgi:hypothetical protein
MIMKRILLFSVILSFGLVSFAQKSSSLKTKEQRQVVKTVVYTPFDISDLGNLEQTGNATVANYSTDMEGFEVIGNSYYDFWTNSSVDNRICMFDDGTMAAVYTFGTQAGVAAFPERGTGYNYFDGTSWGPIATERIETDRSGWPSIAAWGENGEINVSHYSGPATPTNIGLAINTRPTKGTGDWTEVLYESPFGAALFPRMVTGGEDNEIIHLLYSFNQAHTYPTDPFNPGYYNRSLDGGVTWDIQHELIDGMTEDDYQTIGGDNMIWAEPVGETIAFGFADTWYTDMVVMKSDNNGDDWDKIVVWEHPYPFFNWDVTLTDSLWAPDGTLSIALDATGKVHLAAGIMRVNHDAVGTTYGVYYYGEGIVYWNEDMDPFEAEDQTIALDAWYFAGALVEDVNYIGWGQDMDGDGVFTLYNDDMHNYRNGGASTMPAIACGNNGEVIVAYAGISEIDVYNELYNYRRIWTRQSFDNGATWTAHYNINHDITQSFDECIHPVLNKNMNNEFHLIYNADYDVGTGLDGDHDYADNRITYYHDFLPVGIGNQTAANSMISVSQNYPNPATSTTRINVELVSGSNVSLEVSNIVGQVVYAEDRGTVNGVQSSFVINVTDFTPGVYFYTIKVNEESVTKKMLVE